MTVSKTPTSIKVMFALWGAFFLWFIYATNQERITKLDACVATLESVGIFTHSQLNPKLGDDPP